MAMIVPTFARRPIVGYSWIVLAAVGTGFLSFGLWVHHMFAAPIPEIGHTTFRNPYTPVTFAIPNVTIASGKQIDSVQFETDGVLAPEELAEAYRIALRDLGSRIARVDARREGLQPEVASCAINEERIRRNVSRARPWLREVAV